MKMHFLALILISLMMQATGASAEGITWDAPVRMTDENTIVQYSAVTADLSGGVHVFWAYKQETEQPSNLLFYRYFDGQGWTEPTDVFAGADWDTFSRPAVVCDPADQLHLIWNGVQGLRYSTVPAAEAADAKRWQAPSTVAQVDALGNTSLAVGSDGIVHVVYSRYRSFTDIMYVRSEDKGYTWSEPQSISVKLASDEQIPDSGGLTIDSQGVLHVVWSESYPPEYLARQVLYARSLDNGSTWTQPQALSDRADGASWNGVPNVATDTQDRVHIMWACGDPVGRCYRSSSDQGLTWSDTLTGLFQDLIGSSGRDAMVADSYGNIYWAGSLRFPQAFYASVLSGDRWQVPPRVLIAEENFGGLSSAHFPRAAIGMGNQLHLTLVEFDGGPLWYLHGQTSSPRIEATVVYAAPALAPTSTRKPTIVEPPPAAPTVTARAPLETHPATTSQYSPIIIATLAVLVLLLIAAVTSRRRKRL